MDGAKLDFSKLILQKSSTDQQGDNFILSNSTRVTRCTLNVSKCKRIILRFIRYSYHFGYEDVFCKSYLQLLRSYLARNIVSLLIYTLILILESRVCFQHMKRRLFSGLVPIFSDSVYNFTH